MPVARKMGDACPGGPFEYPLLDARKILHARQNIKHRVIFTIMATPVMILRIPPALH
jgi:hypothetical protein